MSDTLKYYYQLTKPGIVRGNALSTLAGFLLAARGHINIPTMIATLVGLSLVVASACVFNNLIDRDIDSKMARTKKRALVQGTIKVNYAVSYGLLLGIAGTLILLKGANILATLFALLGFFFYVVVYGYYKRRTVYGTVIGSISGSLPPVVGYCAASNHLDAGAGILFLIMTFWQMPHFYAIAMFRLKDYKAAGIPVLPAVKGLRRTKVEIIAYVVAFLVASISLTAFGYAGKTFLVISTLLALWWLQQGYKGFNSEDDIRWARKMFGLSLMVLLVQSLAICLNVLLP